MARSKFSLADQLRNDLQIEDRPVTSNLFEEDLVDLDTFIHDRRFLGQKINLGQHQYDLVRHMEQIYLPNLYPELVELFGDYWNPVRFVNKLNVQWGKGAGKDFAIQIAFARISYLLWCLKDPQDYYGFGDLTEIHILNVAMNADQAKRAFFRPMGNAIKRSPWFKQKLTSEITDQGRSIRLDKQIELISGHSQAEAFEGLSPIAVVLDEISGFESAESKAAKGNTQSMTSAEAIYDIVETSASSRFPESYKVAAISYPRFLHDPIQKLCAEAEASIAELGDASIYYVDGPRATWDVNPRFDAYKRVQIPESVNPIPDIASYVEKYKKDAALARAKYECKPERSSNRFMRNDSAIAAAFPRQEEGWEAPVQIHYYWGLDEDGARAEGSYDAVHIPNWQVAYSFSPELKPMEGAVYAVHVDLGVVSDHAGIAMCHVKNWERRDHAVGDAQGVDPYFQNEDKPIVKVDFVAAYEANLQAVTDDGEVQPREIQLRWARNLIRELRRQGFIIGLVTFDTYQSKDSIQILNNVFGIESDDLSVDRNAKPYTNLKEVIYDNRLEGYYNELLIAELEGLTLLPNGKIDHPPGGSKDMADAICGAVYNAIELGGDEGEAPEEVNLYAAEPDDYYSHYDPLFGNIDINISPQDLQFSV